MSCIGVRNESARKCLSLEVLAIGNVVDLASGGKSGPADSDVLEYTLNSQSLESR